MHRLATVVAASLFVVALAFPAFAEQVLGKGVTGKDMVAISELLAHPEKYEGQVVRVQGLITDVCAKRGCWINLAGDKEFQTMRIKVKDGEIVFPLEVKGKQAVAEGVFTKKEITPEQALKHAEHQAEEKGEKFDPAKAKDLPTVIFQVNATGAVIK